MDFFRDASKLLVFISRHVWYQRNEWNDGHTASLCFYDVKIIIDTFQFCFEIVEHEHFTHSTELCPFYNDDMSFLEIVFSMFIQLNWLIFSVVWGITEIILMTDLIWCSKWNGIRFRFLSISDWLDWLLHSDEIASRRCSYATGTQRYIESGWC